MVANKYHKYELLLYFACLGRHVDWKGYCDECSGAWNFRMCCDPSR